LVVLALLTTFGNIHAQSNRNPAPVLSTSLPLPQDAIDLGPASLATPLRRIQLVLRRSDEKNRALLQLLARQQDRASPQYHHWLTPVQFGQTFGPTDAELGSVTSWLTAHGFSAISVNRGRSIVEFSGSVGAVQSAFRTSIHAYSYAGKTFYANLSEAAIPDELATSTRGIVSLGSMPQQTASPAPLLRLDRESRQVTPVSGEAPNQQGAQPAFTYSSSGGSYFAVTPYDFATIYDVTPLWSAASPIDGTGHTIAIVGDTAINAADFVNFRQLFGLPLGNTTNQTGTQYLNIYYNGPTPSVGSDEDHADGDTQWATAVAKGATIDYVASESTEATRGIDLSASYIVDNNLADILVDSYATCELQLGSSGNSFYQELWEQAAAQGISVVAAAGDSGNAGCDITANEPASNGKMVSGMASTPFNVAVGGTEFYAPNGISQYVSSTNSSALASANGYIPEDVWNDTCTNPVILAAAPYAGLTAEQACNSAAAKSGGLVTVAGGGGGASSCTDSNGSAPASCSGGYAKPSWQTGPGVPSDGLRDLPDVALFAARGRTNSFYFVCQQDKDPSGAACSANSPYSDFRGLGGSEIATPAFAGILAMVVQETGARIGNPNYVLYGLAQDQATNNTQCSATGNPDPSCVFHDVVLGNNAMPCSAGSPGCTVTTPGDTIGVLSAPAAAAGYDLSSGLGSVDAANLVAYWSTITPPASSAILSITPASIVHGSPVTATVMVTGNSPTGEVSITAQSANGAVGFGSLSNGTYTGTFRNFPGGTYGVQAYYEGDANNAAAESNFVSLTVTPEPSTTTLSALSYNFQTGATAPVTTVPYGTYLILSDSVAGASGQGIATGSVSLLDNGSGVYGGSFPLNSSATIQVDDPSLPAGTNVLSSSYSGDPSFEKSTAANVTVTVTKAATFSSVSVNKSSVSQGSTVTLSAVVSSESLGSSAPSGTISFFAGSQLLGVSEAAAASASSGFREGIATLTVSAGQIPLGSNSITVSYSGDTNYLPSASAAVLLTVTSTTLSATATTDSVTPASAVHGPAQVTFSASVTAGSSKPDGNVQFIVDGRNFGALVALSSAGQATLATTSQEFGVGTHTLVAVYLGDGNTYRSSSSPATQFVITSATKSTVNFTVNSTTVGQGTLIPVMVTVVPASPVPTGTVQLQLDGYLYGLPLDLASGSATLPLSTSTIQVGTHQLNVFYSGDANYASSYGASITITIVAPGSVVSQVNITNLAPTILIGSALTFTATVTPSLPTPTGIYEITLDGGAPGAPILLTGASQSLTIPASSLPLGTHTFTVFYSGDDTYSSATSSLQTVVVAPPPNFTISLTPSAVSGSRLAGIPSVQVTLTPINLFTQPIAFSCSGLPADTACVFSPPSVILSGLSPATDTLSFVLDTGVSQNNGRAGKLPFSGAFVSLAALLLFIPLRRRRSIRASLVSFCALTLLFALSGCGSGYRSGLSPTGTFNVTVTASSAGVTHSANVALTLY
jgi:subtilase family serine protease